MKKNKSIGKMHKNNNLTITAGPSSEHERRKEKDGKLGRGMRVEQGISSSIGAECAGAHLCCPVGQLLGRQNAAVVEWIDLLLEELPMSPLYSGLRLPVAYCSYVIERELENIHVITLDPDRLRAHMTKTVREAISAYEELQARVVDCVKRELLATDLISDVEYDAALEALAETIDEREIALYRAPIGLDLFSEVIWPVTKQKLARWFGIECSVDDSRYQNWLAQPD